MRKRVFIFICNTVSEEKKKEIKKCFKIKKKKA